MTYTSRSYFALNIDLRPFRHVTVEGLLRVLSFQLNLKRQGVTVSVIKSSKTNVFEDKMTKY